MLATYQQKLKTIKIDPKSRTFWFWLLLLALLLRLFALGAESFWYDEAYVARLGQLSFDHMLITLQGENSPPLYFVFEWLIGRTLGVSEFTLRLPSALIGTFTVYLLGQIALSLGFDALTTLVVVLLGAVLPGTLYYSQEARMYIFLLFAVLAAVLTILRRQWFWYGAATLLALYIHNLALVTVLPLNLLVLFDLFWTNRKLLRKGDWRAWLKIAAAPLITMAVVTALWLPWIPVEIGQTAHMVQAIWRLPMTLPTVIAPLFDLTVGQRVPLSITYGGYGVALGFSIYALWLSRSWLRQNNYLIVVTILAPVVLLALVSFIWKPVYLSRALIGSLYLLCLPWAYAVCHARKLDRRTILALLVPLLAIGVLAEYWPSLTLRLPWRERVTTIEAAWQPGDVMYYCSSDVDVVTNVAVIVGYYMPNRSERICSAVPFIPFEVGSAYFGYQYANLSELSALGYKRAWFTTDSSAQNMPDFYCQQQINYPDAKLCLITLNPTF